MAELSTPLAPLAVDGIVGARPLHPSENLTAGISPLPFADSPFGRLPGEIRNRIYEYTFYDEKSSGITLLLYDEKCDWRWHKVFRVCSICPHIAITQTCRGIRVDSLKMYYALSTITLRMVFWGKSERTISIVKRETLERLRKWAAAHDTRAIREIKHVHLQCEFHRIGQFSQLRLGRVWAKSLQRVFHRDATFKAGFRVSHPINHENVLVEWDLGQGQTHESWDEAILLGISKHDSPTRNWLLHASDFLRSGMSSLSRF